MEYPNIDPVAISIGPLNIHWYGIMYLVGFALAWVLAKKRSAQPDSTWTGQQLSDLLFYTALGVILGGRVGYMLFYNFTGLLNDPLSLFYIWEGGMSFHGGLLGVILALFLFSRHTGKPVINVMDFIAPLIPIGLGAGRIGNFIGGELWGKPSTVPWAMEFPADPLSLPRHPSQLYEFALEGVLLFAILWWFSAKPRPAFAVSALFCLGYGVFRFIVEFFRAPDEHIGYLAFGWLTMGQVLTLPMIAVGAAVLYLAYSHNTFGRMINAQTGTDRT